MCSLLKLFLIVGWVSWDYQHCCDFTSFFSAAQCEREGRVKSQVQMGTDDVCDNLPSNEPLTAQTQNLNEMSTLTQTQDEGGRGLFQKASLGNNGRRVDEEGEKDESVEGNVEEDEEDLDEMMREAEEEEEEEISEGSSSLICCQSPDTPMTDSSYSETGREHKDTHRAKQKHFFTHEPTLSHSILFTLISDLMLFPSFRNPVEHLYLLLSVSNIT